MDGLPLLEGPAVDRPFALAGERAALLGNELEGPREIHLHPVVAVRNLRSGLPPASRVRVSTAVARRRLDSFLVETSLVLFRLAAVVVRWERHPDAEDRSPLELDLEWWSPGASLPSPARPSGPSDGNGREGEDCPEPPSRKTAGTHSSLLRLPVRGGAASLLFALRGGDVRWRTEESDDENGVEVQAHATSTSGGPVELVVTVEREGGMEAEAALSRSDRLEAEVRARARTEERDAEGALGLTVDDEGVGEALAWARRRLAASVVRPAGRRPGVVVSGYGGELSRSDVPGRPEEGATAPTVEPASPSETAAVGLGLLAAGLHERAGEAATACREELEAAVRQPVERPDAKVLARLLQTVALHALWTGDARFLGRDGATVRGPADILLKALGSDESEETSRIRSSAPGVLHDLADALEGAALGEAAETLRSELEALDLDPAAETVPGTGMEGELRAWRDGNGSDPERELARWKSLLLAGTRASRGLWGTDPARSGRAPGRPWHTVTTALLPARFVFGLLGARADAAYGRLRLAPVLPRGWSRMDVRGIRVGDVRVRLSYRRVQASHTFVLEPTSGRIPLNVIFEPLLPVPEIGGVSVGGEAAAVDVERLRGRVGVRLQIPLDARREITVKDGANPRG